MELRHYINTLLKWWWLIVASVLIAAGASYVSTSNTPGTYASQTTLMVGQTLQNPNPSQSDYYIGQILAQSYTDLAKRDPVLRSTLQALKLNWDVNTLKSMVSSQVVAGTQLFDIIVVDTNPARAKALADELARQLILQSPAATDPSKEEERQFILTQIDDIKTNIKKSQDELHQLDDVIANASSARQIQDARDRRSSLQGQIGAWQSTYAQLLSNLQVGTSNFLRVVEPAQLPTVPISPGPTQYMLLASALGLALACGAAFLLEYIDDTIKTPDDVRQVLGLPLLGSIVHLPARGYPNRLITARHPRSPAAEAYRVVRTNLQFSAINAPLSTLMVTSPNPLEGKSVTAANIAVVLAQAGKRVILIDADLRRPTQHKVFTLNNGVGLTSLLMEREMPLEDALQSVPNSKLKVLTSGPLPPVPSELLGSARMQEVLGALKQVADVIILDTPPVIAVADATVLSTLVDGTLMVIRASRTRRAFAVQSKEVLTGVGARVVGVVLNFAPGRGVGYYRYYTSTELPARPGRRLPLGKLLGQARVARSEAAESAPLVTGDPVDAASSQDAVKAG